MKFLPLLRPVAVLSLLAACGACSTPANRRELYNDSYAENGAWHDYSRRREAEKLTGVSAGGSPTVLAGRSRPTAPPPSTAAVTTTVTTTPAATAPPAPVVAPEAPAGTVPAAPNVAPATVDPTIITSPTTPVVPAP